MVRDAETIVFDTETSGVDWRRNFPIGYVVGASPNDVVYVPVRHGGGGNLPDPNVKIPESATDQIQVHQFERDLAGAFQERRRYEDRRTIGHSVKFDCHAAANAGIMLGRNIECTQNNEALLNEFARSYSLDACAERYGVPAKKGDMLYEHIGRMFQVPGDRTAMGHYWRLPGNDDKAVEYAIGDGITTWHLAEAQHRKIKEEGIEYIHWLESQLIWTLFRIERRGIKVNTSYLERLIGQIDAKIIEAKNSLPENFNVRSPKDMKEYMERLGHTDWPTTEKGNPSFTEKWLKQFPEGQNIVTVRKWSNLNNSFVKPMLEEHVHNGRVYASINQLKADDYGTLSGRFSCSKPNLQQIPKRDKDLAIMFRTAFEADEGMEFWEADWSQAEPRIFAHYSRDEALVNGYNADPPRDMHQITADAMNVDRGYTGKRMGMGLLTGMQPKTFAQHMGWDEETARYYFNEWFKLFPGIQGFQQKAKDVMKSRGYVKTILGRKCRLEQPRFAYRAVSRVVQGSQADMMKLVILRIDKMLEEEGDPAQLLMSVHDSYEWQAPKSEYGDKISKEIVRILEDVQSNPINLRIPFKCDVNKGANWAEATFGESA
jgi:DNA polymerase-1